MTMANVHIAGINDCSKLTVNPGAGHKPLDIFFDNAIIFPGLINSHDHLELNLFPPLKNNAYTHYTQWGTDIHQQYQPLIQSVLKVPENVRVQWGIYKNLLNGITTVVNHGKKLAVDNSVAAVFQNYYFLHSPALEKYWKFRLNAAAFTKAPLVIHIGEGINGAAGEEIDSFIRKNYFNKKTIAIHGIAMNKMQAKAFEALVWCPVSNLFLFNQTAPIDILKTATRILFGTDATLSGDWSIWEHLRTARSMQLLTDTELFNTVTATAAQTWQITNDNTVVAKRKNNTSGWDSFYAVEAQDILLVVKNGAIVLYDETLHKQVEGSVDARAFSRVYIGNACKYVYGDLPGLIKKIQLINPDIKLPVAID